VERLNRWRRRCEPGGIGVTGQKRGWRKLRKAGDIKLTREGNRWRKWYKVGGTGAIGGKK
jgi:hypothetical protein